MGTLARKGTPESLVQKKKDVRAAFGAQPAERRMIWGLCSLHSPIHFSVPFLFFSVSAD